MKLYIAAMYPKHVEEKIQKFITDNCQGFSRAVPQKLDRIHITTCFLADAITVDEARQVLKENYAFQAFTCRFCGFANFGSRVIFAGIQSSTLAEMSQLMVDMCIETTGKRPRKTIHHHQTLAKVEQYNETDPKIPDEVKRFQRQFDNIYEHPFVIDEVGLFHKSEKLDSVHLVRQ